MKKFLCLPLLFFIIFISGCYTIPPATIDKSNALQTAKTAYVVINPLVIGTFQNLIYANLQRRGIETTVGPMSDKPSDVDIYVTYVAYHSWDMAMYLKSYTITIYDNKNNTVIATDSFSTGFFHDFANSQKVTNMLMGNMFK